MEIKEAINLIERGVSKDHVQSWADLGAGSGLFTKALAALLPKGSSITAIDKNVSKISAGHDVDIKVRAADFLDLDFEDTDGVVMANSLHYVKDQKDFLSKLAKRTRRLILVEYNTDKGNQWVPYPVSFNKLKSIYPKAERIGEHTSQYHKEGMYAALIVF